MSSKGSRILLSDGLIELRVQEVLADDVVCEIVNGGTLGEQKGINLPGIPVRVPSSDRKGRKRTLNYALRTASTPSPFHSCAPRRCKHRTQPRRLPLAAKPGLHRKLEKPQAIEHPGRNSTAADGIMWPAATWALKYRRKSSRDPQNPHHPPRPPSSASRHYRHADCWSR